MRAMRERLKAVETLKKAAEKLGKGASRGSAGKRKNRNYAHSKTAVQNFFYAAACASHCPNNIAVAHRFSSRSASSTSE